MISRHSNDIITPILPSRDIRINLLRRYNICITNKWVKSLILSGSLSFSVPDFITVACASVPLSDSVKNLGVTFVCHLTMKTHVSNLVRSANFELRRISPIPSSFVYRCHKDSCLCLCSRLDYCNSLLFGCPQYLLNKLQKVQNNTARLVLRVSKTDHISPHLASLHWLPIDSRIQF